MNLGGGAIFCSCYRLIRHSKCTPSLQTAIQLLKLKHRKRDSSPLPLRLVKGCDEVCLTIFGIEEEDWPHQLVLTAQVDTPP